MGLRQMDRPSSSPHNLWLLFLNVLSTVEDPWLRCCKLIRTALQTTCCCKHDFDVPWSYFWS